MTAEVQAHQGPEAVEPMLVSIEMLWGRAATAQTVSLFKLRGIVKPSKVGMGARLSESPVTAVA